jgi:translation elongation factor EF-Tu-like GTPase
MTARFHEIEADIHYLTTEEGGRKTGVGSGYRGQFFYDGEDHDAIQFFPRLSEDAMVELGTVVRALVRFPQDRWVAVHARRIAIGTPFEIREGRRTVGRGIVTRV